MLRSTSRRLLLLSAGLAACGPLTPEQPGQRAASRTAATAVFSRLILGLDPASPAALSEPAGTARAAVGQVLGSQWQIAPIDSRAVEFEITPPPAALAEVSRTSAGDAWQKAYALEQQSGVEYAEPIFVTTVNPGEEELEEDWCPPAAGALVGLGLRQPKHLQDALKDPEWSLGPKGANVKAAWKLFEARGVIPGGRVVIAHPDTGYRRHPEIWSPDPTEGGAHPEDGWNFFDDTSDPFDELSNRRWPGGLGAPGHGTRTGSVIVSGPGSQLGLQSPRWVSGVAPGARLIPLRVSPGVLVLDMGKLAAAVRHAAGDDRTRVKRKADVISMSLGGLPSRTLREAIEFAADRNVIVLAAAGNHVGTVVWPARYRSVVAVAASNVKSDTWDGSSRGKRVDITAPGESVWCASTRPDGDDARNCLQVSSGTSYAVATTAGVAALWLSYHRDNPRLAALRQQNAVAWGFRQVVRTAYRRVDGWKADRYGPGIVDAASVLAAEVPSPPAAPVSIELTPCEKDLEAVLSIFDEAPDPKRRLSALLSSPGAEPCALADVGDEIALAYATDANVRNRLDALSRPNDPSPEAIRHARAALLVGDMSSRLRGLLSRP